MSLAAANLQGNTTKARVGAANLEDIPTKAPDSEKETKAISYDITNLGLFHPMSSNSHWQATQLMASRIMSIRDFPHFHDGE